MSLDAAELANLCEIAVAATLLLLTGWALKGKRWVLASGLAVLTIAAAAAAFALFIQNASRGG
jgi:hypothetical protein